MPTFLNVKKLSLLMNTDDFKHDYTAIEKKKKKKNDN